MMIGVRSGNDPALQQELTQPHKFLNYVRTLSGWLEDYAALRTMDLLRVQSDQTSGPLLEIGVFSGRYFSLLLRSALTRGEAVLGVDTFQYLPVESVKNLLAPLADPESIIWYQGPSTTLSPRAILSMLGEEPRFVSIDGSHEFEDVVWDLRLTEDILSPHGIVAVDDFLNPLTLGVNQGVHEFFSTVRNLVPFAYTANKLFLCRPDKAAFYRNEFENVVEADEAEPRSEMFRQSRERGRHHVEQRLWGRPLLIVP